MSAWIEAALDQFELPLQRFALRLTGCPQRAADVVQDVFLTLCRQRHENLADHLAPWLYTAVRRRAIDLHRKERPMHTIDTCHAGPEMTSNPADTLIDAETHSALGRALKTLSPRQQEMIRLKFHDGLRYHEIAAALGLSPGTVAKTIHEAIARLRQNRAMCAEALS